MSHGTSDTSECIVALFDTPLAADRAIGDLLAAGIAVASIDRHEADRTEIAPFADAANDGAKRPGFWSRLFGAEPEGDTGSYDRSLADGSTVVAVRPTPERFDDILDILEGHHPVDMDEREADAMTFGALPDHLVASAEAAAARVPADGLAASRADDVVASPALVASPAAFRVVYRGGSRVRRYAVEGYAGESDPR